MAADANPLELSGIPHNPVNIATLLQSGDRFEARNLDNLNNLRPIQWGIPKMKPTTATMDEELSRQMNYSSDSAAAANTVTADCHFGSYPGLLGDHLMNEPSNLLQPTLSPDSSSNIGVYRSQGSIQDGDPSLGKKCLDRDKRVRVQFGSDSSPLSHDEAIMIDEKHKDYEKRVNNRVAASKCRQRKRREEESLKSRARELEAERDALKSRKERLRLEILDLKNEVLKHAGCNSEAIQEYISEAARKIA
ncbi:hypothetical protein ABKA04_002428 [Annulohypoxylon sp. FPYF3050]